MKKNTTGAALHQRRRQTEANHATRKRGEMNGSVPHLRMVPKEPSAATVSPVSVEQAPLPKKSFWGRFFSWLKR